jgi:hypothetical protein
MKLNLPSTCVLCLEHIFKKRIYVEETYSGSDKHFRGTLHV